jgi:Flp pilus assembly pilin Flp
VAEHHVRGERGASAVEYALLVFAVALVIVAVVFGLGALVDSAFSGTSSSIDACTDGTC